MRTSIGAGMAAVLGLAGLAVAARAEDEKVPLDKVPAAVMKAVKDKFPGAAVKGAEKEVEDGKTTYEIASVHDGHKLDVSVKEDGTIAQVEKEIEAKDLPKAVAEAVKAKYPKGSIKKSEEITEGEKATYEVVVAVDGKKPFEVVLDPKGKILEDEGDDKD